MARLGFVGDVYLGPDGGLSIDAEVRHRLAGVDLLVANLEGPVTGVTQPAVTKGAYLRSGPSTAATLGEMGIGVASLANNHMFDFGVEGFAETVEHLERAGIAWVGAGRDLVAARRPLIVDSGGVQIGFLAYSSDQIETVCATGSSPGCAPLERELMASDVEALAAQVDVTIVLLHWGLMGYALPTPQQRDTADSLIGAGTTLVIGSHPHVIQGREARGSALVAFSLGDFAFHPVTATGRPIHQYRARQTGMILTVEVEPGRVVSHSHFLTRQQGARLGVETSQRRRHAIEWASTKLSGDRPRYPGVWKRYVFRRTLTRTVRRLAPWKWRTIGKGTVQGFRVAIGELLRRR